MAKGSTPRQNGTNSQRRGAKARTKRILNVRLLLATLAVATVAGVIAYFWYSYRVTQVALLFEQRAAALEKEGRWREAAGYLNRHLLFEPNDTDVRDRLVVAMEHAAQTPSQRRQFVGLLYETLGHMPDRNDLRLKLANQLLEMGGFAEADVEAQKFLSKDGAKPQIAATEKEQNAARRVHALTLAAHARRGGPISIATAVAELDSVLEDNPGDVKMASVAAALYRENPLDAGAPDAASKADEIMNRLVQSDPRSIDALIARYIYRQRYGVGQNARQDLDAALALDPEHVEALLLAANEEAASGQEKGRLLAEQRLLKVVELKPSDPRGYIGLARLYAQKGNLQQAVDSLLQGRSKVEVPSFELDGLLAEMLLNLNRLEQAEKVLADFDNEFRRRLPEFWTDDRMRLENIGRLLRARLDIARNDLGQAVQELNAVIASVGRADVSAGATERTQAHVLRAAVMTKLGRLDLAAADWQSAAALAPNLIDARVRAAVAYLELGRPAEAIRQLETYLQSPSASSEARLVLVQAHLQQQMRLAADERNWTEFLTALGEVKKQLPNRWEPILAEVVYLHSLGNDDAKHQAMEQLGRLEGAFPRDGSLWGRLVVCYQQLGVPAEAERALARYGELEANPARRALLRSALRVQQGRSQDALESLEDAAADASANDRRELQVMRIRLLMAAQQLDAAQKIVSELIAASTEEPGLLMLGLEVALTRNDFATAVRWEDALKTLKRTDDFEWRYFRARRLVEQIESLDSQARAELESLIESLRSDRPDWYPVVALAGRYGELVGNRRHAIEAYQLSIDLGDRRPETIQRLVAALFADGRSTEAQVYLSRLGTEQPSDGKLESLAIAVALKENGLKAALGMAQKAVDRGSKDPMHYVWLAILLWRDGQRDAAERTFRDSVERFPHEPMVWNALFSYLLETKQPDRARRALDKWSESVAMDEPAKRLILGRGYELLRDPAAAEEQYRAAIAKDSRNVDARLRLARLSLLKDVVSAKRQFEEVLKIDPKNAEARRYFASLLAASGEDEDWSRAVKLLQAGGRNGADDVSADDRLRAILLSQRGHNRDERLRNYEAARGILTARINRADGSATELDRMLLAGIYEQEAVLRNDVTLVQAARDTLRPLVDREQPPADYLATYIQLLLRHIKRDPKPKAEDEPQYQELRAALISDARLRIDELQTAIGDDAPLERRMLPVSFRTRLLVADGRGTEGMKLLNEVAGAALKAAKNEPDRAKLLLQLGNLCTAVGYHKDAEAWYRQLLKITPKSYVLLARSLVEQQKTSEAFEVCLRAAEGKPSAEVATVLAQLLAATNDNRDLDLRAEPLIDTALQANGNNVELIMSVAVRHVTKGNNEKAVELFRRAIELQPNHVLALNNLATLLAEHPDQLDEARKYVERAVAVAGRSPALLDTLGTILIRAGQNREAVTTLEEAVAGAARDPRYYFHLAVAYQRSGRAVDAQKELDTSLKLGLEQAILTSGDQELLASLKRALTMQIGESNGKPQS